MAADIVFATCDGCGKQVHLTKGETTVGVHYWTRRGVKHRCDQSGRIYPRHRGEFTVIQRDTNGIATLWLAACRCGLSWTGPEYEDVAGPWMEHATAADTVVTVNLPEEVPGA